MLETSFALFIIALFSCSLLFVVRADPQPQSPPPIMDCSIGSGGYDDGVGVHSLQQFVGDTWANFSASTFNSQNMTVITGAFNGTLSLGTAFNISSTGSHDFFVAKLDSQGKPVWAISGSTTNGTAESTCITVDQGNNIYIGGYLTGPNGLTIGVTTVPNSAQMYSTSYERGFLVKLSNSGNFMWGTMFHNYNRTVVRRVVADSMTNVLVMGDFSGYGGIWNTAFVTNSQQDSIFVTSLQASSGSAVWIRSINITAPSDRIYVTASAFNQNQRKLFVGGYYTSQSLILGDMLNFSGPCKQSGGVNAYIMSMNSGGTVNASTSIGDAKSDLLYSLAISASNVYAAGFSDSMFQGLPEGNKTFIMKFSHDLQSPSVYALLGSANISTITVDPVGNLYGVGTFSGTVKPTNEGAQFTSASPVDSFFFKFTTGSRWSFVKSLGDGIYNAPVGLSIDSSNRFIVISNFQGNADFGRFKANSNTPSVYWAIVDNQCRSCNYGRYSPTISSMTEQCRQCPAGTYLPTYGGKSQSDCITCSPGSFQSTPGSSQCIQCSPGKYNSESGGTKESDCTSCAPGSFGEGPGGTSASSCKLCPPGTYSNATGAPNRNYCNACAPGTFNPNSGSVSPTNCLPCPPGNFNPNPSSAGCMLCFPGTYMDYYGAVNSTECKQCPMGSYSGMNGAVNISQCLACPAGTYLPQTGSVNINNCIQCPIGSYSPTRGNIDISNCLACPSGTYQNLMGKTNITDCKPCPAGSFNQYQNASFCSLCPLNMFNEAERQTSCKKCDDGAICLPGSIVQLAANIVNNETFITDPYVAVKVNQDDAAYSASSVSRIATAAIVVGLIICTLLFAFCFYVISVKVLFRNNPTAINRLNKLAELDLFSINHYVPTNESPKRKGTLLGVTFSLIFIIGVAAVFSLSVIDTVYNNVTTNTYVTPEHILPAEFLAIPDITGTFSATVSLYNFLDSRCSARHDEYGFKWKSNNTVTRTCVKDVVNNICNCTYQCVNCALKGYEYRIAFTWQGEYVMASLINYTVSLPHFFNKQQFVVRGQVVPDGDNLFFRGNSQSSISLSIFKTYYTYAAGESFIYNLGATPLVNRTSTGYVASVLQPRPGGMVSDKTFNMDATQQSLSVEIVMSQNPSVFRVEEVISRTIVDFLAKVFALFSAVFTISSLVMVYIERIGLKVARKKELAPKEQEMTVSLLDNDVKQKLVAQEEKYNALALQLEQLVKRYQVSDDSTPIPEATPTGEPESATKVAPIGT